MFYWCVFTHPHDGRKVSCELKVVAKWSVCYFNLGQNLYHGGGGENLRIPSFIVSLLQLDPITLHVGL